MNVHFPWMTRFEQLKNRLSNNEEDDLAKAEGVDCQTRLLLCQALIKCADISNPVGALS